MDSVAVFAGVQVLHLANDAEAWETFWQAVAQARAAYEADDDHFARWREELGGAGREEG